MNQNIVKKLEVTLETKELEIATIVEECLQNMDDTLVTRSEEFGKNNEYKWDIEICNPPMFKYFKEIEGSLNEALILSTSGKYKLQTKEVT